jgi:hypothetical protein
MTRPETPVSGGSRKMFDESRPGTMEAFLENESDVKAADDELPEIQIRVYMYTI